MLTLDTASKRATISSINTAQSSAETGGFMQEIRRAMKSTPRSLGKKEIDGRTAQGFCGSGEGIEVELWVDDQTQQPILIQMKPQGTGLHAVTTTFRDIVLNRDLPDSLFSLQPPEGYTLGESTAGLGGEIAEQDLAEGLRELATRNNGVFPQIAPMEELQKLLKNQTRDLPEQEQRDLVMKVIRLLGFAQQMAQNDFHYAGAGAKLNDAGKRIAWWKPKGAAVYRVLYGDLTFRNEAASTGISATKPTSALCEPKRTDNDQITPK